jgi:hypothetical protein
MVEVFPVTVVSVSIDVGLLVFLGLLVPDAVAVVDSVPDVVVISSQPMPKRLSHLDVVVIVVFLVVLAVDFTVEVGFGVGGTVFVETCLAVVAMVAVVDFFLFSVLVDVCEAVSLSSQPIPRRLSHFAVVVNVCVCVPVEVEEGFVVGCDFSVVWDDLVVEESFGQPIPRKLSHEEVVEVFLDDLGVVVEWVCLCVVVVVVGWLL